MNILINISHPAHVHFFRNFIKIIKKNDHKVFVLARDKDNTFKLLNAFEIEYKVLGKHYKSLFGKLFGMVSQFLKLTYYGKKYKIDLLMDAGPFILAPVSFVLHKPYLVVNNTDVNFLLDYTKIFGTYYLNNSSFTRDMGEKQILCNSINELAFLHPKYFKPNPRVLENLGVTKDERFILLRFVRWKSVDDLGFDGYSVDEIRDMAEKFAKYGKVFISSEYELPSDLEKLQIEKNSKIRFGQMQDIEYYATLFFGESGAMASECAMLGTPAIFVSPKKLGFTEELDKKYGLIYDFKSKDGALEKAFQLLQNDNLKREWSKKRDKLLQDKINYTDFLVWYIENFPESYAVMKSNPDYQYNFN